MDSGLKTCRNDVLSYYMIFIQSQFILLMMRVQQ
jgi:hypothetical protein